MKKLVFALAATAAFTGQAIAADMAVKARPMAPPPVAVANWTGCYISGGGGYGLWRQENTGYLDGPPRVQLSPTASASGDGWFGTVGGGCDYQFSGGLPWNIVIGAFADYDFADINGRVNLPSTALYGTEKLSDQWAVGGRIGVLVTPQLLTYVSGGYTEAHFDRVNFDLIAGVPPVVFPGFGEHWDSRTYSGWFIGTGYEYQLSFLPGLFWKTEYRASHFDIERNRNIFTATNTLTGVSYDSEKWTHAVRSQLVWRFNFGGAAAAPVAARY